MAQGLPGRPQLLDQGDLIFAAVDGGADAVVDRQQLVNAGASAIAGEITPGAAFWLPQRRTGRDRHLPGGVSIRLPGLTTVRAQPTHQPLRHHRQQRSRE